MTVSTVVGPKVRVTLNKLASSCLCAYSQGAGGGAFDETFLLYSYKVRLQGCVPVPRRRVWVAPTLEVAAVHVACV